jgi:hypothetical protein
MNTPLDDVQVLVAELVEQGFVPEEALETAAAVLRLRAWPAPTADAGLASRILYQLEVQPSAHRPAIRQSPRERMQLLLRIAQLQVRILQPAFWVSCAGVVALGALALWLRPDAQRSLVLYLLGPLAGYFAVAPAFRGTTLALLECELACPPSPRQLILARLLVVLAYAAALGVCLSMAVAWQGAAELTLAWLAPLLLEVGLTLLLTLRLPTERAAAVIYGIWATLLGIIWGVGAAPPVPSVWLNLVIAAAGAGALVVAVYAVPHTLEHQLRTRAAAA